MTRKLVSHHHRHVRGERLHANARFCSIRAILRLRDLLLAAFAFHCVAAAALSLSLCRRVPTRTLPAADLIRSAVADRCSRN